MKVRVSLIILLAVMVPLSGSGCIIGGRPAPRLEPTEESADGETRTTERDSHWSFLWVRTRRADLHEGPGTEYYVITPIVKGARLIMLAKQGEWYQVNLRSASIIGWIHESAVSDEEVARED